MLESAIRELDKALLHYNEHLIAGGPDDYAEYREIVGHIRGLQMAKQLLEDLLARSERDFA